MQYVYGVDHSDVIMHNEFPCYNPKYWKVNKKQIIELKATTTQSHGI